KIQEKKKKKKKTHTHTHLEIHSTPNPKPFTKQKVYLRLLHKSSTHRLDVSGVRSHPFFKGVVWDTLHSSSTPPFVPVLSSLEDFTFFSATPDEEEEEEEEEEVGKDGDFLFIGYTFSSRQNQGPADHGLQAKLAEYEQQTAALIQTDIEKQARIEGLERALTSRDEASQTVNEVRCNSQGIPKTESRGGKSRILTALWQRDREHLHEVQQALASSESQLAHLRREVTRLNREIKASPTKLPPSSYPKGPKNNTQRTHLLRPLFSEQESIASTQHTLTARARLSRVKSELDPALQNNIDRSQPNVDSLQKQIKSI
ncbi:hypothetical protein BY458DRAFT_459964, partial [Sporodiniella umbellata]